MVFYKRKQRALPILLLAAVMVMAVLGSAVLPNHPIDAEECYRQNAASMLYLRSYYASGSLKATGSGFVVSSDGLVVTAAHVVKNGDRIAAVCEDESELELTLVTFDEDADIAVLRLPEGRYRAVRLAQEAPNAGAAVRAMGFPIKGTDIITEGIVSAPCAEVSGNERMLVTCDIVNGMSGGPIFNEAGRVVGVVSGSIRTMDGIHLSVLSEELFRTALEIGIKTAK